MPVACGDGFSWPMSIEVLEALACIAEIEREIDNLFRLRPPTERKRIDGTEFVRMRIGSPAARQPGSKRPISISPSVCLNVGCQE